MANSFSSSTLTAERFLVPVAAQLGNHEKGSTGNENASDNEDEVLSVGGVSQPPSPQAVVTSSVLEPASNPTLATYSRLDALQAIPAASEPVSYKSVGQNEGLELDHKLGSQPVIRLTDAETYLDATKAVQVSPTALPVKESSPSLLHEDEMELPRRSPLSGPDRSSSSSEPDIDPGECTSPQPSAALKFSIDNILNPNFGRSLLPGTAANALGRELLHRHPHLYCHPLLTAAKEMLLAVTAAEMRPSVASAPASNYPSRENNHHYFNPHLAALQINNSLLNQSQGISTSAAACPNSSSKKGHGNALYANWRTLNGNNRPDQMSSLTPPSSSGIVMDLSIRSGHGNAGYGAGGSLSSPSHGSASPGGISTCSNSSSGDGSSQLFAAAAGAAASPAATGSGKLATHSGDLLSAASTPATKPESSSDSTGSTQQNLLWPAWVYCTRYSDRPSSGRSPRTRRIRKKDKKPDEKRPRTAFTAEQLARLKTEFSENRYLTEKRRQDLARELQLHENQIKIWFQNKRAKIKKASGQKNPLALQLMAQGLYNHSTIPLRDDEDIDSME